MSIQKNTTAFVCLKRNSGSLLVLVHELFFDYVLGTANTQLYGLLGSQLDTKYIHEVKIILTRLAKNSIKQQFGEKVFIYSFLAASATFFLSFFFMSIVIRDPIPIIDELLVSLAASIAVYLLVRKRIRDANNITELEANTLPRIAALQLRVHTVVQSIEDALHDYDSKDMIALQELRNTQDQRLAGISRTDAAFLAALFAQYIESSEYRMQKKLNRKSFRRVIDGADSDLPLELLIEQLKNVAATQ